MKKIYYIKQHSVFSTDGLIGRLWREEMHVSWLANAGHSVLWLSSDFDHYGKIKRNATPSIEGVEVRQFSVPVYKKNVSISRLLGNWIFAFKLFFFLIFNFKKIDKIICAYPTPESSLVCVLVAKVTRLKLILDIRDNWPEALVSCPKNDLVTKLYVTYVNSLNYLIFTLHDTFIGMSDGVLRKVKTYRHSKTKELCLALPNTISGDRQVTKIPVELDGSKVYISFFGTLNSQFAFDIFSEILSEIEERFPQVVFLVIGNGELYENFKYNFAHQDNLCFLGRKKYGEVLAIAEKSSAFFCFYQNPLNYDSHFTNKLIEYIQFGKPFIHNLKNDFYLNGVRYEVGCSTQDIPLVEFVAKLVQGELQDPKIEKADLSEFSESVVKAKFLEIME